jgi:hypothetical protein
VSDTSDATLSAEAAAALGEMEREVDQLRSELASTQLALQQQAAALQAEVEQAAAARLFMQAELHKAKKADQGAAAGGSALVAGTPDEAMMAQMRQEILEAAMSATRAEMSVDLQAKLDKAALEGELEGKMEGMMAGVDKLMSERITAAMAATGGAPEDGEPPLLLREWEIKREELLKVMKNMVGKANTSATGEGGRRKLDTRHPFQPSFVDPITGATAKITGDVSLEELRNSASMAVGQEVKPVEFGTTPQFHVVMGQFRAPAAAGPRLTKAAGGGGATIKADDELEYLEEKLVQRLDALQNMYENRGWGVRDRRVKSQIKAYEQVGRAACTRSNCAMARLGDLPAAPGSSLWSDMAGRLARRSPASTGRRPSVARPRPTGHRWRSVAWRRRGHSPRSRHRISAVATPATCARRARSAPRSIRLRSSQSSQHARVCGRP